MPAQTSASLTTTGSVTLTKPTSDTLASFAISGTYGTVTFVLEGSLDGTNFAPLAAVDKSTGAVVTSTVSPGDNTTRVYDVPCASIGPVRLKVTAISTGQLDVSAYSGSYVGIPSVSVVSNTTFGATSMNADLTLSSGANLVLTGTTGQSEINLTDNLADACSVNIPSGADLIVFTTTDNAEAVATLGHRNTQSTAVAITSATALKLSDSGGVFTMAQSSTYDVDLPSPTSGAGCKYFFHLTAPGAFSPTITVLGGAATFVGTITIDGATIPATGSTLTFATGASVLGDSIEIRSLATNLYHVRAFASGTGGITIA